MNKEKFKIIGFYILAALLLMRLVIVPWQNTIREKKALLKEYEEAYNVKAAAYERFKDEAKAKNVIINKSEDTILKAAYVKDVPFISIQSEMIRDIADRAEKEKVTVLNFEFPDPTPLKHISEVPVIIRLKGEQKGIVALLREIEKGQKKFVIKRFEDGKGGQDFNCNMTIFAYRLE